MSSDIDKEFAENLRSVFCGTDYQKLIELEQIFGLHSEQIIKTAYKTLLNAVERGKTGKTLHSFRQNCMWAEEKENKKSKDFSSNQNSGDNENWHEKLKSRKKHDMERIDKENAMYDKRFLAFKKLDPESKSVQVDKFIRDLVEIPVYQHSWYSTLTSCRGNVKEALKVILPKYMQKMSVEELDILIYSAVNPKPFDIVEYFEEQLDVKLREKGVF